MLLFFFFLLLDMDELLFVKIVWNWIVLSVMIINEGIVNYLLIIVLKKNIKWKFFSLIVDN